MTAHVLDPPATKAGGPSGPRPPSASGGDDHGGSGEGTGLFGDPSRFGLLAFLGTVSMLFIGFTSAFILRRASPDWRPIEAPSILGVNTAALLASSACLEAARRSLRGWNLRAVQAWVIGTGLLGVAFVGGQIAGWQQLAAAGVFLDTNPSSSFFYLLTAIHGLHLLGGLTWFAVIFIKLRRLALAPGEDGLALFAIYWHFLAALWVYLLFLFFVY
jgi:cytochrome c oxidase subunit III